MKLKRDWLSDEERFYVEYAAHLIGDLKTQRGLDGRTLQALLEEAGMAPIQSKTLTDKLRRGSYSFPFALHALAALGVTSIPVPPLPLERCTLRVTWETYGTDTYDLPKHVQGVCRLGVVDVVVESGGPVMGQIEVFETKLRGLNKIYKPAQAGGLFVISLTRDPVEVTFIEDWEVDERWVWTDPEELSRGR